MTTSNQRELREAEVAFEQFYADIRHKELSRRKVLSGGAALALLSSGGMAALLGACGDDSGATPTATTTGGGAAAASATAGAADAGVTGDWDTTGTPPYKQGLSEAAAKAPAEWKQYPWVYKYGPWRYNWDIPVTRGGQVIMPSPPPANYDVMVNGIASNPANNKLFNNALREGFDGMGAAIEPDLAIGQEHSADYTSWTFKLPANAKFHNKAPANGRLMTADDVAFSFQRILESSVYRTSLRNVTKVTAVDKTTVRFDLKAPALSFPGTLASPHYVVFAPEVFENQDFFKKNPIGTGPFVLTSSEYQNRADWVRHPEYWQPMPIKQEKYGKAPLPLIDKLTWQYFANAVVAKEAFINAQVDLGQSTCAVDPSLLKEQLQRVPNAIISTNPYWSCCPLGLNFNYKNPLFQDKRVRQALSMSINREQVWKDGMRQTGVISASPIPFDFQGYTLPLPLSAYGPSAQYNPQQAKQLLKEAGHDQPLKLQIYQNATNSIWQGALDTVVANWKQAGTVDATLVVRDDLVFTQDMLNKSFPDMLMRFSTPLAFGYTLNELVTPLFLTGSPANNGNLSDPDLDKLLNAWSVTIDPAEGVRLARQMALRIADNVDYLWIGTIGGSDILQPWLRGMVESAHNCVIGIGRGNYKYVWIDQTAPGGRGGKPVA